MSGLSFPISAALAAKAHRLAKSGIRGKAAAEKLGRGIATDEAILLANVGYLNERDRDARLTVNEIKVLTGLLRMERQRRAMGMTGSIKAWMLSRPTGLTASQIRRATKRLDIGEIRSRGWGLLEHSRNGHIWLNESGIAVANMLLLLDTPTRTLDAAGDMLAALAGLMPTNLGALPASLADADIVPLDVTVGELRRAFAAIAKAGGAA